MVVFGVVGLRRVDEEQAGPPKTSNEIVQVVVNYGDFGLVGVDIE